MSAVVADAVPSVPWEWRCGWDFATPKLCRANAIRVHSYDFVDPANFCPCIELDVAFDVHSRANITIQCLHGSTLRSRTSSMSFVQDSHGKGQGRDAHSAGTIALGPGPSGHSQLGVRCNLLLSRWVERNLRTLMCQGCAQVLAAAEHLIRCEASMYVVDVDSTHVFDRHWARRTLQCSAAANWSYSDIRSGISQSCWLASLASIIRTVSCAARGGYGLHRIQIDELCHLHLLRWRLAQDIRNVLSVP